MNAVRRRAVEEAVSAEHHALVQENQELKRRHEQFSSYCIGTVHSLLTHVSSVSEFVSILMDGVQGQVNEKQGKCLAMARGGCAELEREIQRLVDLTNLSSKPQKMAWERVPVVPLLEEVLDELRLEALQHRIQLAVDNRLDVAVLADPYLFRQLAYLLAQRCVELTPGGGSIAIEAVSASAPGHLQLIFRAVTPEHQPLRDSNDISEWQIADTLEALNARNLQVHQLPGVGIEHSIEFPLYPELSEGCAA